MDAINRRDFLDLTSAALLAAAAPDMPTVPIIDTHIHLFDPTRPEGVPWPPKDDKVLYKPALPPRFSSIAEPLGVVGAIEVEASPWLKDNQWVLDVAARYPVVVGTIGDLEPGKPDFATHLEHFHKNPLFRGIRYGNIWNRSLSDRLAEPAFVHDLKSVAKAGLVMDSANPDPALIATLVRLTDKVPELRVMIDHLPSLQPPADPAERKKYEADLKRLSERSQVYVKVSEVLRSTDHKATLDHLWDLFGEDRLVYGSDWPNGDHWGTYPQVLDSVRGYFEGKGKQAAEKYFWKNSLEFYR